MSVQELPNTTTRTAARPMVAAAPSIAIPWVETLALATVLSVALVSHAFNMFNYPLYRQDEGIVSQQAWAFLQDRKLSPYTYTYEHPPIATFMLAVWTVITGGFHTFGPALNSGRVLMLALHLGSSFFIYRTARQLSGSTVAAMLTGVLFSLSPLAVNFQRLVLVDNFMVFWFAAALYFTICNKGRLFYFFIASVLIGLAVMSRETAVFFIPAFLVLVWRFSDPYHRLYAFWGSFLISSVVVIQYVLYAVFKAELFPDAFDFLGELEGRATHVSLFGTFFQNYHNSTPIWTGNLGFASIWQVWTSLDSVLLFGGIICASLNLAFGFKHKENWVVPMLAFGYVLFTVLGGLDSDAMVVVLVPMLALAVGQTLGWIIRLFGATVGLVLGGTAIALAFMFYISNNNIAYTSEVNTAYQQSLAWIKGNIPTDRKMIITDALWVDLHDDYNGPAYPLAHSHWKAANDPDIRYGVFKGDYKEVDFLIMTEEMRTQFQSRGLVFNQQALENSSLIRKFEGPDPIQIRKVNNTKPLAEPKILDDAYTAYKNKFISPEGKVSDATGKTGAELQSQGMQMALWNNDQKTFDNVWIWTAYNLQLENNLFRADAPLNATRQRSSGTADVYTSSRADTDIALALILGAKRWKDESYNKEASYILKGIWENEVITVNKRYYLKATAAPLVQLEGEVLLNVGAFSPQAYQLFADMDKTHNWLGLYKDGYDFLRKASWYGRGDYNGVGLPPGLVVMNLDSEELRALDNTYGNKLGDFDEEAQQVLWRVALDYHWNKSEKARDYIESTGWFLIKYWQKWQNLAGQYTNNGLPVSGALDNLSSYSAASSMAYSLDQIELAKKRAAGQPDDLSGSSSATEILARAFMGSFSRKNGQGFWLRKDDIAAQQWGWMGTALQLNRLGLNFDQYPQPAAKPYN